MNAVTLLWMLGGVMALLATMLAALIVARRLDDSRQDSRAEFTAKMTELANRASQRGGDKSEMSWLSGGVSAALLAMAAASADAKSNPEAQKLQTEGRKKLKRVVTGLAIGGAILMAIVGKLVGHGS